jgi:aryl-alcohol dehydrogenase-like predicted oxidoreductase
MEGCAATVVTWGSLGRGLLTGKFSPSSHFSKNDSRSRDPDFQGERFRRNLTLAQAVDSVSRQLGRTASQVALRWVLDTPHVGCALFGAKTADQVQINLGSLGWRLPEEHYRELERIPVAEEPENKVSLAA